MTSWTADAGDGLAFTPAIVHSGCIVVVASDTENDEVDPAFVVERALRERTRVVPERAPDCLVEYFRRRMMESLFARVNPHRARGVVGAKGAAYGFHHGCSASVDEPPVVTAGRKFIGGKIHRIVVDRVAARHGLYRDVGELEIPHVQHRCLRIVLIENVFSAKLLSPSSRKGNRFSLVPMSP